MKSFDDQRRFPLFTPIVNALSKSKLGATEFSEREISRLTGRLIHFIETNFGRDSDPVKRLNITKFPIELFSDFRENGAMYHMVLTCYQYAEDKQWRNIDLKNESRKEEHLEMIGKMDKALKSAGFIALRKVFFSPLFRPEEADELRDMVQNHNAAVVSSPEVASHIIYPDPDGTREHETDAQVLIRFMTKENRSNGMRAFVHWWYHPNSYDEWLGVRDVVAQIEEPQEVRKGPWHVQARWIRDLARYNEWMNELDYEMPLTYNRLLQEAPPTANGIPDTPSSQQSSHSRVRLRLRR